MQRKTLLKLMAILFLPAVVAVFFNLSWLLSGLQAMNTLAMVVTIILFVLAIPFVWFLGIVIQARFLHKISGSMTGVKVKQALKPEVRRKNAREYINELRMTDPAMMASNGQEMVIIRHEPSPSREDAIQWDMFIFTTTQEYTNWNPILGLDGIPSNKVFYIVENSMTGECYLMHFEQHDEAQKYFRTLWQSGVKKVEASEFEKTALKGLFEEKGKIAAHKDDDKDKESEKE